MLLDHRLIELPIELLDICQLFTEGLSRDFSVHILSQRCAPSNDTPVSVIHARAMKAVIDPFDECPDITQRTFEWAIKTVSENNSNLTS